MTQLTDRRAGIDVVLTNISIGRKIPQDFIGDTILPSLQVSLSTAEIPVWGTEAFRIREDRVGDYSEPEKLDISIGKVLVKVVGHAQMAPVSRRHQKESSQGPLQIDLDRAALETVNASMELAREKYQADLLTATGTYSSDTGFKNDLNGQKWDTNDPLEVLIPAIESTMPDATGQRPNILWMGQPVWAKLLTNPALLTRLYGSLAPQRIPKTTEVAELLGIDQILVGRSISMTDAGAVTKLWGTNAGLVYSTSGSSERTQMFGRTIEQNVFNGASKAVVRFADEKMGASGGDWIKQGWFYQPMVTSQKSGILFYNVV